jgi:cell division protein FtsA
MKREKRKDNIVTGLDVGTTKICAIIGEVFSDGIDVLSIKTHPSEGLKKGVVVDIDAATNSIKKVVSDLRKDTGISFTDVSVGIAGSHIKSFTTHANIKIKGKKITEEDLQRAINAAKDVDVPLDREILQVLPLDFIVDGKEGIKNPVGKRGSMLEVKAYVITGAVVFVQNLIRCCENAGLKVRDIILQPIASATAVLSDSEFKDGAALIDIGGGTTDLAVYKDDFLRHINIWGIGGNHFTNDISIGLDIPFLEAERIKKYLDLTKDDPSGMDISSLDGVFKKVKVSFVLDIIKARAEELMELIKKDLDDLSIKGVEVPSIVLTGGGSLLSGIEEIAKSIFNKDVRLGKPDLIIQDRYNNTIFSSPTYSTGFGLILDSAKYQVSERGVFYHDSFAKIIEKMSEWFKRIIGKR